MAKSKEDQGSIPGINFSEALAEHEKKVGTKAEDMVDVLLYGGVPPINRLDAGLKRLQNCEKLSLSSNWIERIVHMQGLHNLKILSIGRNLLKSLDGIGAICSTIEQMWASYNQIRDLRPLRDAKNLRVLYVAHNSISDPNQLDHLRKLRELQDFCFYGNPFHERMVVKKGEEEVDDLKYRNEIRRRLPQLKRLDNITFPSLLSDKEFYAKFETEINEARAKMVETKREGESNITEIMENRKSVVQNTLADRSSSKQIPNEDPEKSSGFVNSGDPKIA